MQIQTLLLIILALAGYSRADCKDDAFPIYAGGRSNETVNCFIYDEATELLIVGGNTTSDDFAPAAYNHGFMYAVDLDGNWAWGKFFYNVSYAVNTISGCQLSSDGSSLTVFGEGNTAPVIMDMNMADGTINKFITLEHFRTHAVYPSYHTRAGIYNDKSDPIDG